MGPELLDLCGEDETKKMTAFSCANSLVDAAACSLGFNDAALRMHGFRFGVWGSGFRGLGFRDEGLALEFGAYLEVWDGLNTWQLCGGVGGL